MIAAPILQGRRLHTAGGTVATTCGRTAEANRAASFWQSRHPRHERPALADLSALARTIRSTWK